MVYFDNAATSRFKPKVLFDTMFQRLNHTANPGRGGHDDAIDAAIAVEQAREQIRTVFGAEDDRYAVIFTTNCTEALNLAILGYLRSLDEEHIHVVTTANEHNSVLRPLHRMVFERNVRVTVVAPRADGGIGAREIAEAITPDTRLVCVNHISNVTGSVSDVEEICALCNKKNIRVLIDTAQSAGHLPLQIAKWGADYVACAGHKGLHGCQGTGVLICNREYPLDPIRFGGTGTQSEMLDQPTDFPEGYEAGTLNTVGICGLGAAAMWTHEHLSRINMHTRYLTGELLLGLKQIPTISLYSQMNTGVVSFNVGGYASTDVGDYLNACGFAVRCGLHCAPLIHRHLGTIDRGTVRVSIGFSNTVEQVRNLVHAVDRLARGKVSLDVPDKN